MREYKYMQIKKMKHLERFPTSYTSVEQDPILQESFFMYSIQLFPSPTIPPTSIIQFPEKEFQNIFGGVSSRTGVLPGFLE